MSKLNPLDYPVCLAEPARIAPSAWTEHVPFGMFIVDILRPKVIVELGTHYGVSYCAFCQAVAALGYEARAYAVDTWEGDAQSGFYGTEVLDDLRQHHDPLYAKFSRLVQATFDEARSHFEDGSIDLLHIDGFHTYDAVKHDFESWLPKLSPRGIVMLHDVNAREGTFGVWQLWTEIKRKYPAFEFHHAHGLGVAAVGDTYPRPVQTLLASKDEDAAQIRHLFHRLGHAVSVGDQVRALEKLLADRVKELNAQLDERAQQVGTLVDQATERQERLETLRREMYLRVQRVRKLTEDLSAHKEYLRTLMAKVTHDEKRLKGLQADLDAGRRQMQALDLQLEDKGREIQSLDAKLAESDQHIQELNAGLSAKEQHVQLLNLTLAEKDLAASSRAAELERALAVVNTELQELKSSKAWRLAMFFRNVRMALLPPGGWLMRLASKAGRLLLLPFGARRTFGSLRDLALVRKSELLDREWYLAQFADVQRAGMDPARHYLLHGGFEGRDPGPKFSSRWYLEAYPDVQRANINPLVHYLKFGRNEGRRAQPLPPAPPPPTPQAAVLFLSGCAGDAQRYRCVHQAEQLAMQGYACDLGMYGEVDLGLAARRYQCLILHRVPYGPDIKDFIAQARSLGKAVLFETDDLVFDPDAVGHIAALDLMDQWEKDLYHEGLHRYRATLLDCDAVTVTTQQLKDEVEKLGKPVTILPNVVSREMVDLAEEALNLGRKTRDGEVVLAYLSGTYTHNVDFLESAEAVLWALDTYPHVRLQIVGPLDLDKRFEKHANRIEYLPFQRWQNLPGILRGIDVNLAPLEKNNRFTESKSCIKYLEAGLVKVPTIASRRRDFVRAIRHGENGFLADTPQEWQESLRALIESADLRRRMGQSAYEDIHRSHTTAARASLMENDLRQFVVETGHKKSDRLTVNWILRAPIASRGGGYRTIFRLANYLGSRGHNVRVYVEAIAHLEGLSDEEILEFTEANFGPLSVEMVVGHDNIQAADASIATNWPTAYTVADHRASNYKFYFVQDYEPEFYDEADPSYAAAEKTYDLPLLPITIGNYLADRLKALNGRTAEVIPFGIDSGVFRLQQPPEKRNGRTRVLFFARPGLKRRGYDIGLQALEMVKRQAPELEIAFFGAEADELGRVPFEFTNLGVLAPEQLAREMNRAHIMLSLSLSNISWVPYEGMACGLAVVEADVPSVRRMVEDGAISLAAPTAEGLSAAILELRADKQRRMRQARAAAQYVQTHRWEDACRQFESILVGRCVL